MEMENENLSDEFNRFKDRKIQSEIPFIKCVSDRCIKESGNSNEFNFSILHKFIKGKQIKTTLRFNIKIILQDLTSLSPYLNQFGVFCLVAENALLLVIIHLFGISYNDLKAWDRFDHQKKMWWIFFLTMLLFTFKTVWKYCFNSVSSEFVLRLRIKVLKSIIRNNTILGQRELETMQNQYGKECDYVNKHAVGYLIGELYKKSFLTLIQPFYNNKNLKFKVFLDCIFYCLGAYIFFWVKSWRLTLIITCVAPVLVLLIYIFKKLNQNTDQKSKAKYDETLAYTDSVLRNLPIVKSFRNEALELEMICNKLELAQSIQQENSLKSGILIEAPYLLQSLFLFMLVFTSGCFIFNHDDDFEVRISYFVCLIVAAQKLMNSAKQYKSFVPSLCQYHKLFNKSTDKKIISQSLQLVPSQVLEGDIIFDAVIFRYPQQSERRAIDELNLQIENSQFLGITGQRGCGKSTILNLIMRFYDVKIGKLQLQSNNFSELSEEWLRSNIGYITTDNMILNREFLSLITMGLESFQAQAIDKCLEDVQLKDFTSNMNLFGYGKKTVIGGKNGLRVTPLQEIQIALARVVLRDPKLIILDDITRGMDSNSEKIVLKLVNQLFVNKNKTVVMTSRKITPIKTADQIIILERGKIIADGIHGSLIQQHNWYSSQFNDQQIKSQN